MYVGKFTRNVPFLLLHYPVKKWSTANYNAIFHLLMVANQNSKTASSLALPAVILHLPLVPPSISVSPSALLPCVQCLLRPPSVCASCSIHPSHGYSTHLCSRQTICCTLLMTDPTWPVRRLAATIRFMYVRLSSSVCVCVYEQVHTDWWWDIVCSSIYQCRCMFRTKLDSSYQFLSVFSVKHVYTTVITFFVCV